MMIIFIIIIIMYTFIKYSQLPANWVLSLSLLIQYNTYQRHKRQSNHQIHCECASPGLQHSWTLLLLLPNLLPPDLNRNLTVMYRATIKCTKVWSTLGSPEYLTSPQCHDVLQSQVLGLAQIGCELLFCLLAAGQVQHGIQATIVECRASDHHGRGFFVRARISCWMPSDVDKEGPTSSHTVKSKSKQNLIFQFCIYLYLSMCLLPN